MSLAWSPTCILLACSPGLAVGKSAFAIYLLSRAVRAGRSVVYVSDKAIDGYIFHASGKVTSFPRVYFQAAAYEALRTPEFLVLFDGDGDGNSVPIGKAATVLITSPKPSRYKLMKHMTAQEVILPVFSRTEIDDMVAACFPHLGSGAEPAGVDLRYSRWGGIPRYVLALLAPKDQADLDRAFAELNLDRILTPLGSNDLAIDNDNVSHRLFHLKPAGETPTGFNTGLAGAYDLARVELGSPYIIKRVYQTVQKERSARLQTLLAQPIKEAGLAKF